MYSLACPPFTSHLHSHFSHPDLVYRTLHLASLFPLSHRPAVTAGALLSRFASRSDLSAQPFVCLVQFWLPCLTLPHQNTVMSRNVRAWFELCKVVGSDAELPRFSACECG